MRWERSGTWKHQTKKWFIQGDKEDSKKRKPNLPNERESDSYFGYYLFKQEITQQKIGKILMRTGRSESTTSDNSNWIRCPTYHGQLSRKEAITEKTKYHLSHCTIERWSGRASCSQKDSSMYWWRKTSWKQFEPSSGTMKPERIMKTSPLTVLSQRFKVKTRSLANFEDSETSKI